MKIIHEESVYLIPEDNNIVVLAGENQKDVIDCFTNQFVKKKRNYCKVFDIEGQLINPKELNFIYYPYTSNIQSNFEFDTKSIFNTEITNFIQENEKDFTSIEQIRNGLHNCISDSGMYKLEKILTRSIQTKIDINIQNFDVSKILSMMNINIEEISEEQQYIMVYNLLLYIHRNEYNVVYLDFPIQNDAINWLNTFKEDNILFLIDNQNIVCDSMNQLESFSMIILSNQNYMETYEYDIQQFNDISYIQNPYIMLHKQQQTEKNIRLMEQFEDKMTTFYLKFSDTYIQNKL